VVQVVCKPKLLLIMQHGLNSNCGFVVRLQQMHCVVGFVLCSCDNKIIFQSRYNRNISFIGVGSSFSRHVQFCTFARNLLYFYNNQQKKKMHTNVFKWSVSRERTDGGIVDINMLSI